MITLDPCVCCFPCDCCNHQKLDFRIPRVAPNNLPWALVSVELVQTIQDFFTHRLEESVHFHRTSWNSDPFPVGSFCSNQKAFMGSPAFPFGVLWAYFSRANSDTARCLGKLLMSHTAFSCTTHLNKTTIFSIEAEVSSQKFTEKCFSIHSIKTSGINR